VLGDLRQFGFDDDKALALSLEHRGIIKTTANIQAVRNQKQRNLDALTTACIGLRGVWLLSTNCEGILQTAGKNFLNNITQIFKRCSVRKGILNLNNEILIRNKGDIIARNMRGGLSAKDASNAITKIKDKGRRAVLTHADLLADKLGDTNLTIGALGLLIVREYTDELFPSFSDKDVTLPPVTVTSARENAPVATTPSTPNRSTKRKAGPGNPRTRSVRQKTTR